MSHHSRSMSGTQHSNSHHSSTNTKMYINPHFVQAKTVPPAPHGLPHFNPNFYSKYHNKKCDVQTSTAPMIHINPNFVNVKKLQNDLVNAREARSLQTPVCSLSCDVRGPDFSNYVSPQKEPIPSTISRSSTSRYKLVNVIKSQSNVTEIRPQVHQPPRIALQQVNLVGNTTISAPTSTYGQPSKSRYKLVRGNNSPKTVITKSTVRVGRYKTVPLQRIVSTVNAKYPTKPFKAIENNISEWGQYKRVSNRNIDRRKLKIISRYVQVPTVTSKFDSFNKSVNIRGSTFSITDKSLKLIKTKCDSLNLNTRGKLKVRVNGRTYVQKSQSLFVRSPFVVKNRESLRKNNVPCPVYRKFGKCVQKEKGQCSLLHDKRHVTICRKFLRGECRNDHCLLSHQVTAEKMPTCSFYLQGCCNRENCPYLHVKLSDSAAVCTDFLKGYCEMGDRCAKRHVYLCPEYAKNGKCGRFECLYPHTERKDTISRKIVSSKYQKNNAIENVVALKGDRVCKDVKKTDEAESNKAECSRYYSRGGDESQEGTGDEIHTTRQKLGTLPSFIKI